MQNLNLEVKEGTILGLLGANGAGKSTTINMLLGFLKPDSGTIQINKIDASKQPEQTRQLISYIPESVNLYPYLSGLENIDYFCKLAGLNYTKTELKEHLTTCGLDTKSHTQHVSGLNPLANNTLV